ncbi:hypothetical protein FJZ55_01280 [Candidatus Woesearchaeota archaeon]|nr:hypothetical protein [Candidatus Woesearchaeota archaeon]
MSVTPPPPPPTVVDDAGLTSVAAADMITLISTDGASFAVQKRMVTTGDHRCKLVETMVEDGSTSVVPLIGVSSKVLAAIMTYCSDRAGKSAVVVERPLIGTTLDAVLPAADADFIGGMSVEDVYQLANGAQYMGVDPLIELCAIYFAISIRSMSLEEINNSVRIKEGQDLTPEELRKLREDNSWVEDL